MNEFFDNNKIQQFLNFMNESNYSLKNGRLSEIAKYKDIIKFDNKLTIPIHYYKSDYYIDNTVLYEFKKYFDNDGKIPVWAMLASSNAESIYIIINYYTSSLGYDISYYDIEDGRVKKYCRLNELFYIYLFDINNFDKKFDETGMKTADKYRYIDLYKLINPYFINLDKQDKINNIANDINQKIERNVELVTDKIRKLELENYEIKQNIEEHLFATFTQTIKDINNKLENLEKENKLLKEQIRNNELELHYLKSINTNNNVKYNYEEIKNRKKQLHNEFKRVAKLMKLN